MADKAPETPRSPKPISPVKKQYRKEAILPKDSPPAITKGSNPIKRRVNFQLARADDVGNETFNLPDNYHKISNVNTSSNSNLAIDHHNSAAAKAEPEIPSFTLQQKPPNNTAVTSDIANLTDANFEERHKSLKDAAWQWATENFSGKDSASTSQLRDLPRLCYNHPELAEYVNFLASCPSDETWEEFFITRKRYLAFAVLGKALEVHVFGQEMFGASEAQVQVLRSLDLEMIHQDGFDRQGARAAIVNSLLSANEQAVPANFFRALADLQGRITALVSPLQPPPSPPSRFHDSLSYILLSAACLAIDMRRKPSAIYYMRPITRESPLDLKTTHVVNSDQFARGQLHHEQYHEPIVRIVAWPIIEAYHAVQSCSSSSSSAPAPLSPFASSDIEDSYSSSSSSSSDSSFSSSSFDDEPSKKKHSGLIVRRICKGEAYVEWGIIAPGLQRAHYRDHVPAGPVPPELKSTAGPSLRQDIAARLPLRYRLSMLFSSWKRSYRANKDNYVLLANILGVIVLAIAAAMLIVAMNEQRLVVKRIYEKHARNIWLGPWG